MTPVSAGSAAGKYFATHWNADHGSSDYPSSDTVSVYCVDSVQAVGKQNSWTYRQMAEATDACASAAINGLR